MYPRIIITATSEKEAFKLNKSLRMRGIFTEIMTFDQALNLKESPTVIVVMSKKYSSKAYAILWNAKAKLSGTRTISVGDADDYEGADIDYRLFYTVGNKGNRISDSISKLVERNFAFAERNAVTTDFSGTPFIYFRGTRILLSDNESQIVHILASFEDEFIAPAVIASYVHLSFKSISAYVSTINKTARHLTGHNMIFSSRIKKGYSLFDPRDTVDERLNGRADSEV